MESNTFEKFVDRFGAKLIDDDLRKKLMVISKGEALHPFIESGLFYCHRDLNIIVDKYLDGKKFYLYTGRGPSSERMHLGHLIPFQMTAYLQRLFDVQVVIQITNDEKFLTRDITLEEADRYAASNIEDIKKCGFIPEKTFIFTDTEYIGSLYRNILKLERKINLNQIMHVFGKTVDNNIGDVRFPITQMAPCFSDSFPHLFSDPNMYCLVVAAIDQDPYFRLIRDVAAKLKHRRPALIYSKYLPSLMGPDNEKMSSSVGGTAIFLGDTPNQVKKKIGKAFSGGQVGVEKQRELGANIDVDVAYQYLNIFHPDRKFVEEVGEKYSSGKLLTGEVKGYAAELVNSILGSFRE